MRPKTEEATKEAEEAKGALKEREEATLDTQDSGRKKRNSTSEYSDGEESGESEGTSEDKETKKQEDKAERKTTSKVKAEIKEEEANWG